MRFKKFIPINILAVCAALCGGLLWRVVFRERQSINWDNPRVAELNLWWWHLTLWSCALLLASVVVLFALFRKYVDLRGVIATVALLTASWAMFVVCNISSDVVIFIHLKTLHFSLLSTAAEVIDMLLWLATFFVLFRTVDDVRSYRGQG